ncbi:Wzz/FepE/Etk N-terminal domain-containing protein [Psychromonas sp. Urea-02u-13]|uniref:Wzz/FepE/Etk N-terminal domain-containing protein n=1 Tax=Psychromonas sp. Urea-02u-13 TaxID=2058326 RepID=UPI000C31BB4A|nr:Wzz/FepE/Etk N-terminal domain-containing protein [Psychromonas sp. Urea-02u-13]PKG37507.1 LPS O-antigen length regulator [Psychromonas sp. Urea-02u-13]
MNQQYQNNMMPLQQNQMADDEIDLKELFLVIWKGKWIIILLSILFAGGGVFYAISQPNTYTSAVLLAPAQDEGSSGLGGQLGGLAALAGVNIGGSGGTDVKTQALAVLQSRIFIDAFIEKNDLLVPLMASEKWIPELKEWDQEKQKWNEAPAKHILDAELYDIKNKQWLVNEETKKPLKPTMWEANKEFKTLISTSEDKENGMVTISVTHHSPIIAQQWAELLVVEINAWMKNDKLTETEKNIGYLRKQLEQTAIAEVRTLFFQMIEEQFKNKMLAEVQAEYVFKTIDPAIVPEEKAGPKRALICVLATLLGGMFGVFLVLVRHFIKKPDETVAVNEESVQTEPAKTNK